MLRVAKSNLWHTVSQQISNENHLWEMRVMNHLEWTQDTHEHCSRLSVCCLTWISRPRWKEFGYGAHSSDGCVHRSLMSATPLDHGWHGQVLFERVDAWLSTYKTPHKQAATRSYRLIHDRGRVKVVRLQLRPLTSIFRWGLDGRRKVCRKVTQES